MARLVLICCDEEFSAANEKPRKRKIAFVCFCFSRAKRNSTALAPFHAKPAVLATSFRDELRVMCVVHSSCLEEWLHSFCMEVFTSLSCFHCKKTTEAGSEITSATPSCVYKPSSFFSGHQNIRSAHQITAHM